MKLPDITPAQIKADVIFILGIAGTLGLRVDNATSTTITATAIAAFAFVHAVITLSDMLIRKHRAQNITAITAASVQTVQAGGALATDAAALAKQLEPYFVRSQAAPAEAATPTAAS